jgi:hypothetical protein
LSPERQAARAASQIPCSLFESALFIFPELFNRLQFHIDRHGIFLLDETILWRLNTLTSTLVGELGLALLNKIITSGRNT